MISLSLSLFKKVQKGFDHFLIKTGYLFTLRDLIIVIVTIIN